MRELRKYSDCEWCTGEVLAEIDKNASDDWIDFGIFVWCDRCRRKGYIDKEDTSEDFKIFWDCEV